MKKALAVSLDEDLIKWINSRVKSGYRNRSHLVEEALNKFKKEIEEPIHSKYGSMQLAEEENEEEEQ